MTYTATMSEDVFSFDAKDPVAVTDSSTVLDRLRTEVARKIERSPIEIPIPERPTVSVVISPNLNQAQLAAWRKRAGEGTKNGMQTTEFAAYVVAGTTKGIKIGDELVADDDGVNLTFTSSAIKDMVNADTPTQAVRAFFGLDPHVESAALAIMDHAGYGDDVDAVDPTKGS